MNIRKATFKRSAYVIKLTYSIGLSRVPKNFFTGKFRADAEPAQSEVLVYELDGKVLGFIAFDFLTQLVVKGDFARISCFAVDENARGMGVGKAWKSILPIWL
jgi:ribosomal protein S18 acetylase RimI-like enzyme